MGRPGLSLRDDVDAYVESVQVGRPQDCVWLGRPMSTSIVKHEVRGPVAVHLTHLDGDEQSDPRQHGGPDKAVYAYAAEDVAWWSAVLGRDLGVAAFGQNLTTTGLRLADALIGERWHVGTAVLQVTEPRTPCWKLGMLLGDPSFPRAFARARRSGVLLRVLREGHLQAGDAIEVDDAPGHGVTAAEVLRMYYGEPVDMFRVLAVPELAGHWRAWAAHRTVWHDDEDRRRTVEDGQRTVGTTGAGAFVPR